MRPDTILDTPAAIYRLTCDGRVFTQSKIKIPIVGKGKKPTGKYKLIIKPEREMTYAVNNRGYKAVVLHGKTKMVHRLVAEYYCTNPCPEEKDQVNHLDGNKFNNHYSNLEWCTLVENVMHARATGLWVQPKGHKINYKSPETRKTSLANLKDKSCLMPIQVKYIRKYCRKRARGTPYSATQIALRWRVSPSTILDVLNGKTYTYIK